MVIHVTEDSQVKVVADFFKFDINHFKKIRHCMAEGTGGGLLRFNTENADDNWGWNEDTRSGFEHYINRGEVIYEFDQFCFLFGVEI